MTLSKSESAAFLSNRAFRKVMMSNVKREAIAHREAIGSSDFTVQLVSAIGTVLDVYPAKA